MSEAAQDVFLSELEYLSDKVYIIMLTTELGKLKPTLCSRAVSIHLTPLKVSDTIKILEREVSSRHLTIQGGEATLRLIAEWSENKPRTALSVLSAFNNESVSEDTIKEFIGYLNEDDVLQLIRLLSGPLVTGIDYISNMRVSESLVPIVTEFIKLKSGFHSYKIKYNDAKRIIETLQTVTVDQLSTFLYGITSRERLTRKLILNSFIRAHKGYQDFLSVDRKTLITQEQNMRADNTQVAAKLTQTAPTLEDLLAGGKIVT